VTTVSCELRAGASSDATYRGWYRLCLACWIILGLASCASLVAILQDVYSTTVDRVEGRAASIKKNKQRTARDVTAAAAAAAGDDDGDTTDVRQGDVSLQSNVTELVDQHDQRL